MLRSIQASIAIAQQAGLTTSASVSAWHVGAGKAGMFLAAFKPGLGLDLQDPRNKHFWTEDEMPPQKVERTKCQMSSQDGKTFLITGGSSGIGYHCAEGIAKKGGDVIIAARNLERSQKAARMIKDAGARGKAEGMHLDLSSFRSIVSFAKEFLHKGVPLHALVENAGVFHVPHDRTQEGFETTIGTNYFGHFLLTHLLMEKMKKTAQADGQSRVVATSSLFELLGTVFWDDLGGFNTKESGLTEYSNSKLMTIMVGREINKRLKGSGVEFFLSQPGLVQTELNFRKLDSNRLFSNVISTITKFSGQDAVSGSLNLQRPATDPTISGHGGAYFSPPWIYMLSLQFDNAAMREPGNGLARDEAAWARLYDNTLHITNQKLKERDLGLIEAIKA